jgi:hypothetical protein
MIMKNPFKSKYYFRIIDRIATYEDVKAELERKKLLIRQSIHPAEHCALIVQIAEVQKRLDLLRALL